MIQRRDEVDKVAVVVMIIIAENIIIIMIKVMIEVINDTRRNFSNIPNDIRINIDIIIDVIVVVKMDMIL